MGNSPFKFGIVSDLDPATGRAKVTLPDENNMPTAFLPIIQEETVGNPSSKTLRVGSHVLVALDEAGNTGAVIGPYYQDGSAPPGGEDVWIRQMADGGVVVYDPGGGSFSVKATSKIQLEVGGTVVTIDSSGVTIKGDLKVEGKTDLKDTKINGITQAGN